MASLIIGCGALIADKVSKKRKERKNNKLAEQDDFESMKAANEQRAKHLPEIYKERHSADGPPSYETAVGQKTGPQGTPRPAGKGA
ncbi:hypothetical protein LTS18_010656 [Coniosporium uncinatum]|uniref:Uncharacterized protein n=1 Tax=Coniosporium uncinatum TaxID=93489 RepID=A0ACC3DZF3_9PEZI|nr:hypothetical protein LTS18_010656 [Coniosporium uncinatum]